MKYIKWLLFILALNLFANVSIAKQAVKQGPAKVNTAQITLSNAHLVAVGAEGKIVYSANGGQTWQNTSVPAQFGLNGVGYGKRCLVTVGMTGKMFYSESDGQTWTAIAINSTPHLTSVAYHTNAAASRAAGGYFAVFGKVKSFFKSNNGRDWTLIETGPEYPTWDMAFGAGDVMITVGNGGLIYRSSDGGASWQKIFAATSSDLYHVVYDQVTKRFIAVGGGKISQSVMLISTDNGLNWNKTTGTGGYFSVAAGASGRIVIGMLSKIRYSTDNGLTWQDSHLSASCAGSAIRKIIYDRKRFFAVGDNGIFLYSTDEGATWTKIETGVTQDLYDIVYY